MARQTRGSAQRRIIGSCLYVRRENLSRASEPNPGDTGERERDPIPAPEWLRLEVLEISGEDVVLVGDLGEVAKSRPDRRYEMHVAGSLE